MNARPEFLLPGGITGLATLELTFGKRFGPCVPPVLKSKTAASSSTPSPSSNGINRSATPNNVPRKCSTQSSLKSFFLTDSSKKSVSTSSSPAQGALSPPVHAVTTSSSSSTVVITAMDKIDLPMDDLQDDQFATQLEKQRSAPRVSKYLENFTFVMQSCRERFSHLLNETEVIILNYLLDGIEEVPKRLLARLFMRKGPWFRCAAFKERYPELGDDKSVADAVRRLCEPVQGVVLFQRFDPRLHPFDSLLELLSFRELRLICKTCKIVPKKGGQMRKDEFVAFLRDDCAYHPSLPSAVLKECAYCVGFTKECAHLLSRLHRLFFLPASHMDMSMFAQIRSFPKYAISPTNSILQVFHTREEWIAYEERALQAQKVIRAVMDTKWEDLFVEVRDALTVLQHAASVPPPSCESLGHLPELSRRFVRAIRSTYCEAHVASCIVTVGISVYEKLKRYDEAVDALNWCLRASENSFGDHSRRGHWWTRLAINLDHLGRKSEVLDVCESALRDVAVKTGDRVGLERRLTRLWKPPLRWGAIPWQAFGRNSRSEEESQSFLEAPPRLLRSRQVLPTNGQIGQKCLFIGFDGDVCNVENFVLQYFQRNGSWAGMHDEGHVFFTLFALVFWDILFDSNVPLVFQTAFQCAPLDFGTPVFMQQRSKSIEARLAWLASTQSRPRDASVSNRDDTDSVRDIMSTSLTIQPVLEEDEDDAFAMLSSQHLLSDSLSSTNAAVDAGSSSNVDELKEDDDLLSLVSRRFELYHGVACVAVNWSKYSLPLLLDLCICIPGTVLAAVFRVLCEDYYQWSGGLPDLLLWNVARREAMMVEVKSTRDRLSDQQRAWIDLLLKAGLKVEIGMVRDEVGESIDVDAELEDVVQQRLDQEEIAYYEGNSKRPRKSK
jgi:hypothetical protein